MSTERQSRIEELRIRVTERQKLQGQIRQEQQRVAEQESVKVLLSSISTVELLGFLAESEQIASAYILHFIMGQLGYRGILHPIIRAQQNEIEDFRAWASSWFQKLEVETECLLATEVYWNADWAKVRSLSTSEYKWIGDIWNQINRKDILVSTADQKSVFGIIEEENTYDCYICQTAKLLKLKDTYLKWWR